VRFVDLIDILAQLALQAGKGVPHLLGEMVDIVGYGHRVLLSAIS
jgi:hypothetical protein